MPQLRPKLTWGMILLALPLAAQDLLIDPAPVKQGQPRTISAELLRYPLSHKALHMLQNALQMSDEGDHAGAVKQLRKTLAKYPDSGAYVYSLIGVEYLKTSRIPEAVDALEQAVQLLPHDASNHANLGLAWYAEAQYDRAELELKRALDLDPHYKMATQVLGMLATAKNTHE